jgi:hypothetical protein
MLFQPKRQNMERKTLIMSLNSQKYRPIAATPPGFFRGASRKMQIVMSLQETACFRP